MDSYQMMPDRRHIVSSSSAGAVDMVGELRPGMDVWGLTAGQLSFIDLVEYVVSESGPCDVHISTWSAAAASIQRVLRCLQNGNIRSMRWLVDRSLKARKPEVCGALVRGFGADAVRTARIHAKFMLVGNDRWHWVLTTSMNLNQNPRIEAFELREDARLYQWLRGVMDRLFSDAGAAANFGSGRDELTKVAVPEEIRGNKRKPLCLTTSPVNIQL